MYRYNLYTPTCFPFTVVFTPTGLQGQRWGQHRQGRPGEEIPTLGAPHEVLKKRQVLGVLFYNKGTVWISMFERLTLDTGPIFLQCSVN